MEQWDIGSGDLVDELVDGKVTVKSLGTAMSPYVVEGKPSPDGKVAPANGNRK